MPVAENCCVLPNGTLADCGLIAIETSAAAVTVNTVEPVVVPETALMVAVPIPAPVANPVLLIVAVDVLSEAHIAVEVKSCVVPSVKVPVAVNCCVVPSAMEGFAGVTAIETTTAAVTVKVVLALTEPEVAVIFAKPVPTVVANPCEPDALLIVATAVVPELHSTVLVMSCVLLSVNVPVAVNC